MNKRKQEGITLIALIITIIVMLILVAVAVRTAVNSGLFGHAQDATNRWASEQRKESDIGNGKVEINGKEYNSIDEYLNRDEQPTQKVWKLLFFDGDTCLGSDSQSQYLLHPEIFYLSNFDVPTKEGFKFVGWKYGEEIVDINGTVTLPEGVYEASIYAVWEEDNTLYTVTYTDGVVEQIVFPDQGYEGLKAGNETPTFVGTPSREGYTFMDWTPAINPIVSPDDANNGIITYTATWKKIANIII